MGDAETDNGVETAESIVTSLGLLWPWIVISYESCRNDRFEILMTRGAQTGVRPYNFFSCTTTILYRTRKGYAAVHQFAHLREWI